MAGTLSPEEIEKIRRLIGLTADNGLAELAFSEEGGFSVTVKAEIEQTFTPATPVVYAPPVAVSAPKPVVATPPKPAPPSANRIALQSPMVGIFYASPAPGEPPFVNVGDRVQVAQPIGLIEAMKVFSEIPSESAGIVLEIGVKSGQLVQQGQPLMYLDPA